MRYLRPVRIDENDEEELSVQKKLRQRGFLDNRGPEDIEAAIKIHTQDGNTALVAKLKRELEIKREALRKPRAPAATAGERYRSLAELKPKSEPKSEPENSSVIPLTLPSLMENDNTPAKNGNTPAEKFLKRVGRRGPLGLGKSVKRFLDSGAAPNPQEPVTPGIVKHPDGRSVVTTKEGDKYEWPATPTPKNRT